MTSHLPSPRVALAALAALVFAAAPVPARAQFGALKKKIQQKIDQKTDSSAATGAQPAGSRRDTDRNAEDDAWKHPLPIDAGLLDRFETAIRAQNVERERLIAAQQQKAASPFARWAQWRSDKAYCDSAGTSLGERQRALMQRMTAAAQAGDSKRVSALNDSLLKLAQRLTTPEPRCQPQSLARPELGPAFFDTLAVIDAHADNAGAVAGGFSVYQFAVLRERVAAYVLRDDRATVAGYHPEEIAALDPRRGELRQLIEGRVDMSGHYVTKTY